MSVHAIHHVTAVTGRIRQNLEYYTGVLGLRLVKKSVNQDDVSAYHLFYADAVGSPGTDMTFFDWPDLGSASPGPATVALTSFRAPTNSLAWWEERLRQSGSQPLREEDETGRDRILFADPEGQRLEIVDEAGLPGESVPWTEAVSAEHALRGIVGVDLESGRPDLTSRLLTEIMGYRQAGEGIFVAEGTDAYARLRLIPPTKSNPGRVGAGGVHHVAFRITDRDEMEEMRERVEATGLRTSGFVDRFYFQSLYFREPGGILFELATDGPGFASDEDPSELGQKLALPPFLEPRRAEIEQGLKPLK